MRQSLLRLARRQCWRRQCWRQSAILRHFASAATVSFITDDHRTNVSTSVQDAFSVPLTLVDIHLRDEQLPFAYFFHETLCAAELEASLERVLASYPLLGGKVNLSRGVIECHPGNSVSLSFATSEQTLQQCVDEAPTQRLTPGQAAHVMSPLFDCLMRKTDSDSTNTDILASIRVTHFQGGGTALGVNLSHVLADAASCVRFVQCWGREMQGLGYPIASNQRSHATCSGMLTPELLDVLDLNGKQEPWSFARMLLAFGIVWNEIDRKTAEASTLLTDSNKDAHEYISLAFSAEVVRAMKAHGMVHCAKNRTEIEFVSTNDVLAAFGWLLKRHLSGKSESDMSMVVNLRGRSDVDDFSCIEDKDGSRGVFGNGITSIIASLPSVNDTSTVQLNDMSAAAVTIRSALTEGVSNIPDRLLHSRRGKPTSTVTPTMDCFAFTSWQHFPLYDISFSTDGETLAAFRGHPSHPLPEGDTYSSTIILEKCGSHTYQLLAPSNKVREVRAFHSEISSLFLDWYDEHTSELEQSVNR